MDRKHPPKSEHNATPLSPDPPILDIMFVRNEAGDASGSLRRGETFGSAIAQARKKRRITIGKLLQSSPDLARFDELTWNEVEQDRFDPRHFNELVLRALESALGLPVNDLKRLSEVYEQAFERQAQTWNLLTLQAHAFRARRARD